MNKEKQYKFSAPTNMDHWTAVKQNPKPLKGLRKLKARNMLKAIMDGSYSAGNHLIRFMDDEVFVFSYRGTLIAFWHVPTNRYVELYAGVYETSKATINQRKEIIGAIENFREVYAL